MVWITTDPTSPLDRARRVVLGTGLEHLDHVPGRIWEGFSNDRERRGRPRKTTTTYDEIVIGLVRQGVDEGLTSEKMQEQVQAEGINVNSRTIRRRLREAGFRYLKPLSKPLLSEHHQKKRLTWARSLMNYDWNQVMATDESVLRLHDIKRFYWQRPGERKICRKVKYTIKINAWCCLSAVGFGRIVCFKNNLNSTFLCNNIYHDGLLPAAREHFGRKLNKACAKVFAHLISIPVQLKYLVEKVEWFFHISVLKK
ncbi:unnamed protein product [Rotaria sp. Silwood1]|nr:unnamed protein product [Rotaria sp. Silwood1]